MWSTLVLISKGYGGHRGIGLVKTVWKVISSIIDQCLKAAIMFHDILHGFQLTHGTKTALIEAKLTQQLAHAKQEPLDAVFLDLKAAYNSSNRDCTLDILVGYGVGPKICTLLKRFWDTQKVAP